MTSSQRRERLAALYELRGRVTAEIITLERQEARRRSMLAASQAEKEHADAVERARRLFEDCHVVP